MQIRKSDTDDEIRIVRALFAVTTQYKIRIMPFFDDRLRTMLRDYANARDAKEISRMNELGNLIVRRFKGAEMIRE